MMMTPSLTFYLIIMHSPILFLSINLYHYGLTPKSNNLMCEREE